MMERHRMPSGFALLLGKPDSGTPSVTACRVTQPHTSVGHSSRGHPTGQLNVGELLPRDAKLVTCKSSDATKITL